MSNPDSFIDEVTEEVRRDRVQAFLRRWAWLGILIVVLIVGGAAITEWRRSQAENRAEAFGDALLSALSATDLPARRAALAEIVPADGEQAALLTLIRATALGSGDDADPIAARGALLALEEEAEELSPAYRDLALLKVMLAGGTGDSMRDAVLLDELAAPGAPYRTLAVEQQALMALAAGDEATAITLLRVLTEEAGVTEALRRRALQMIVALGASPEPA
ncbi:MAG: hypothetical protein AAF390_19525 [Pseudomonadota bacterium]